MTASVTREHTITIQPTTTIGEFRAALDMLDLPDDTPLKARKAKTDLITGGVTLEPPGMWGRFTFTFTERLDNAEDAARAERVRVQAKVDQALREAVVESVEVVRG